MSWRGRVRVVPAPWAAPGCLACPGSTPVLRSYKVDERAGGWRVGGWASGCADKGRMERRKGGGAGGRQTLVDRWWTRAVQRCGDLGLPGSRPVQGPTASGAEASRTCHILLLKKFLRGSEDNCSRPTLPRNHSAPDGPLCPLEDLVWEKEQNRKPQGQAGVGLRAHSLGREPAKAIRSSGDSDPSACRDPLSGVSRQEWGRGAPPHILLCPLRPQTFVPGSRTPALKTQGKRATPPHPRQSVSVVYII